MDRLNNTKVMKTQQQHETSIRVGKARFCQENFIVIAGPCALETPEQVLQTAKAVEKAGAKVFRGSLFKPRTSPYTFQGVGRAGLEMFRLIKMETNLAVETEVLSPSHLEMLMENVDILRIGSRNMDNFDLLKEVGRTGMPIILKRNMCATIEEFLLAAEYILMEGNDQIILCERGIRTFETYTRNTLDILAVPAIKELSHLPIIVDPSHSTGVRKLVGPASKVALAAGADGLLIEVHPNPNEALSDGHQSLSLNQFDTLMEELKKIAPVFQKRI